MAVLYTNNFDAESTGVLPSGWENKDGTWTVQALQPVSGTKTLASVGKSAGDTVLYTGAGVQADFVLSFSSKVVDADSFPAKLHGIMFRMGTGYTNGYMWLPESGTGGSITFGFWKRTGSSWGRVDGTVVNTGASGTTTLNFEAKSVGTTHELRVWKTGDSRPSTASAARTDSAFTSGVPGFYYTAADMPVGIDDLTFDDAATGDTTAPTLSSPSATATGSTTASGSVITDEANGTLYFLATMNATETAATVKASGGTQAIVSSGSKTVSFTGLTPSTTYYAHYVHRDAAGNDSTVANSASFTTSETGTNKYTRVDATDTLTGQAIMILVPNSNAATPYNSSVPTGVIIYCHGAGEDQTGMVTETVKFDCRDALLDAGYILAGTAAHGTGNWGNQPSVDDHAALDKYLRANYNVKGVALWGQSMGGLGALSSVVQGKFQILGALLTYPACSLADMHDYFQTSVETAYGITGSGIYTYANQTVGMDPVLKPGAAFRNVPMRFYASAGDTVVHKAANTDTLAAIVAPHCVESTVVACTGTHGDASHFVPSEYVAFFNRCFSAASHTVTVNLVDASNLPKASLSGLKWAFYEHAIPGNLYLPPVASGMVETTDGSGALSITVTTRLASGAVGWLVVTDSDGNPATVHKAFSGPVTVA